MNKSKPILFNTENVRAILDGRKTVTRRCVKHNANAALNSPYHKEHPEVPDKTIIEKMCMPPYKPGDVMYVRETWDNLPVKEDGTYCGYDHYYYKADGDKRPEGWQKKWHPSIHMPKKAAWIWLKVTDVMVERLQDMMMSDMRAEGMVPPGVTGGQWQQWQQDYAKPAWDSTIKKSDIDKYGWDANPLVWVIEFERCEKPEEGE